MKEIIAVLKKYATFSGRASRREFWMFILFNIILSLPLSIIDFVIGADILSTIYNLAILIPSLAVSVRRLHDINKSGWYMFILLIPVIGVIWLIILNATEGTIGDNEYGPDPKAVEIIA